VSNAELFSSGEEFTYSLISKRISSWTNQSKLSWITASWTALRLLDYCQQVEEEKPSPLLNSDEFSAGVLVSGSEKI